MIQLYIDRLEVLSLREKSLVGVTISVLLASILQFAVMDPLVKRTQMLSSQLDVLETTTIRLEQQLTGPSLTPKKNRQRVLQGQIDALEQQLQQEREQLQAHTDSLVPASKMPDLLRSLIGEQNVELVSLRNIASVSLLEDDDDNEQASAQSASTLYQHGVEIEFRGSYHDLRKYLGVVERQPWNLIWHGIEFETRVNGQNRMKLHLRTLSTDNAWLGI